MSRVEGKMSRVEGKCRGIKNVGIFFFLIKKRQLSMLLKLTLTLTNLPGAVLINLVWIVRWFSLSDVFKSVQSLPLLFQFQFNS